MRFDLRHHPRPAVLLRSMAGDRDTLRWDQRLDTKAWRHVQASGADIQNPVGGVPGHNGACQDKGDRVVGHGGDLLIGGCEGSVEPPVAERPTSPAGQGRENRHDDEDQYNEPRYERSPVSSHSSSRTEVATTAEMQASSDERGREG